MSKTISLKIDDELFNNIKRVSNLFNVSSSEFIRNAVIKELEDKKNDFIVRLSNVEYCDDTEEKEITQLLNKLTDDDIKIGKTPYYRVMKNIIINLSNSANKFFKKHSDIYNKFINNLKSVYNNNNTNIDIKAMKNYNIYRMRRQNIVLYIK